MRAPSRRAASLLSACLLVGLPGAALLGAPSAAVAQTAPDVTAQVSEPEVEVGEPFTVTLKAMSEDGAVASDPQLAPPSGFSVSGPMISTQSYMQFGTGGRRILQGIGATWTLVASAAGTFTIPAPSVAWNGQRIKAAPLSVKVAPQGTLKRRQSGFLFPGGSPFGGSPFGGSWPFGISGMDDSLDDFREEPSLALPRAPSNDVFLHAKADKTKAVVGEQVTISIYKYYRPKAVADTTEFKPMGLQDFLQYSLMDRSSPVFYTARVGEVQFAVRLLEKIAVFPLRTGTLRTGSFSETYLAYNRRTKLKRSSEDIAIQVTEPPAANRPPGYRLGDVGQFQITSLVQPRRVEEGGSVAVSVKVAGTGNIPTSLRMPEKTGIEWLDPEKKESVEAKGDDMVGFRSFGYVVRLGRSGTVDLGTIELPYWNPRAKRYEVARSKLGTIEVTPAKTAAPAPSASAAAGTDKEDPFANLPPPRIALSSYSPPAEALFLPGARFPVTVAAPPLLALAGIAGIELTKRARARLAGRRSSPRTLALEALREAEKGKAAGDERAAAAAVERAVVLAIEAASGVKARGVLKEALASELARGGMAEPLAARAAEMLAACDRARFDPLAAADVRTSDAEALVADLLKAKVS
jgi:hypothetical protein